MGQSACTEFQTEAAQFREGGADELPEALHFRRPCVHVMGYVSNAQRVNNVKVKVLCRVVAQVADADVPMAQCGPPAATQLRDGGRPHVRVDLFPDVHRKDRHRIML